MSTENESSGFEIARTSATGATVGLHLENHHERGRHQGIRVVRLCLRGVDRDYEVDFRASGAEGPPATYSRSEDEADPPERDGRPERSPPCRQVGEPNLCISRSTERRVTTVP